MTRGQAAALGHRGRRSKSSALLSRGALLAAWATCDFVVPACVTEQISYASDWARHQCGRSSSRHGDVAIGPPAGQGRIALAPCQCRVGLANSQTEALTTAGHAVADGGGRYCGPRASGPRRCRPRVTRRMRPTSQWESRPDEKLGSQAARSAARSLSPTVRGAARCRMTLCVLCIGKAWTHA